MQARPIVSKEKDNMFYLEVWGSRPHTCENCNTSIHEPRKYNFHHILEKRGKAHKHADYTRFRHCLWNILLLCWDCHNSYESNPDNQPSIHIHKLDLLNIIDNMAYEYDREHIWTIDDVIPMTNLYQLFPKQTLIFKV